MFYHIVCIFFRYYVISKLPKLEVLDDKKIEPRERQEAERIYRPVSLNIRFYLILYLYEFSHIGHGLPVLSYGVLLGSALQNNPKIAMNQGF